MSDFSKKLDAVATSIRKGVEQEKQAIEAERQTEVATETARDERIAKAHGIAVRFKDKSIEPIMKEVQTKMPGGSARGYSDEQHGFAGWSLEFDNAESIAIRIHFDDRGVWLFAEAHCVGGETVYSQRSKSFDPDQFPEAEAEGWIKSHALQAYKALGQYAGAVRNPPPIVRYNRTEP